MHREPRFGISGIVSRMLACMCLPWCSTSTIGFVRVENPLFKSLSVYNIELPVTKHVDMSIAEKRGSSEKPITFFVLKGKASAKHLEFPFNVTMLQMSDLPCLFVWTRTLIERHNGICFSRKRTATFSPNS